MLIGVLVYLLVGVAVQLLFEFAWRRLDIAPYPHMWPAVLAGILMWPLTLVALIGWAASRRG